MSKRKHIASQEMIDFVARINDSFGYNDKINPYISVENLVKYISRMSGGGHLKNLTSTQANVLFQVAMSRNPVHLSDAQAICPPKNQINYINNTLKMAVLAKAVMKKNSPPMTADRLVAELQNEFVHKRFLSRFRNKDFYKTRQWKELRLVVLSAYRV